MRISTWSAAFLLFLFGLYYRLVPAAGTTTLAKAQGWLHIVGAILFPAGVAIVLLKGTSFYRCADRGFTNCNRGNGAIRRHRVPDCAGLTVQPIQL